MRKEKIPHQAPFAIQAAQLLGRAIGAGLFAITPAGERGMCCKAIKLVTPGFSQSRRCKTTASAKLACLQVDSRGSPTRGGAS
jgi:hypothetical protein